jgi:hypothetical protein
MYIIFSCLAAGETLREQLGCCRSIQCPLLLLLLGAGEHALHKLCSADPPETAAEAARQEAVLQQLLAAAAAYRSTPAVVEAEADKAVVGATITTTALGG